LNSPIKVAVIGLGKIAHEQHLPAIANSLAFTLVAAASPAGSAAGVPNFPSLGALLGSGIAIDAVILCQPPQFRFQAAALALRAGKHVLLEKPPGASSLEVEQLLRLGHTSGKTLFAAWHSRYAPAVEPARGWLAGRHIRDVQIEWREDVRHWHPGQSWIWEPGGLGVFDPGINALSILTHLIPEPLRVLDGTLEIPSNRFTPIGAELYLRSVADVPVHAVFDWRQTGPQIWSLTVETDAGRLKLSQGGAEMQVDDGPNSVAVPAEYTGIYTRFATLIQTGDSDVDLAPLRLVADAFMRCRSRAVEAFD
jgi:D-galactose 1-dehydrogenase